MLEITSIKKKFKALSEMDVSRKSNQALLMLQDGMTDVLIASTSLGETRPSRDDLALSISLFTSVHLSLQSFRER